jgi:hypothetical protein
MAGCAAELNEGAVLGDRRAHEDKEEHVGAATRTRTVGRGRRRAGEEQPEGKKAHAFVTYAADGREDTARGCACCSSLGQRRR